MQPDEPEQDAIARPQHVLLVAVGVVVAVCTVVWAALSAMDRMIFPINWGQAQASSVLDALPGIVKTEGKVVVFVGGSTIGLQISPAVFDAEMARRGLPVTSYNVWMDGANARQERLLVRRTLEAFEQSHRKPDVLVVELTPSLLSTAWVKDTGEPTITYQSTCTLSTLSEIVDAGFRYTLSRGVHDFIDCTLFAKTNPTELRQEIWRKTRQNPSWWPFETTPPPREVQLRTVIGLLMLKREIVWNTATRGYFDYFEALTPPVYAEWREIVRRPENVKADVADEIELGDSREFRDLDERSIADVVGAVLEAKRVAQQVRVIVPPYDWRDLQITDDGRKRRAALLARVERETGIKIDDFSYADFQASEFNDCVHLEQADATKRYTRMLANRFSGTDGPP